MKFYVSSLLLCFTFNAFASCTEAVDQIEFRMCVAEKSENSAIKLKEKQAKLLKKLSPGIKNQNLLMKLLNCSKSQLSHLSYIKNTNV
ncbi:hypothetical protein CWC22_005030 [Pseudoalteromonas rubra]|uniref:Secreted protein n=1 Tax=Pseudoalteromonas rubra TaxID=43658 RepID=A0A5S3UUW2_9GAMM|nr:hypothetical protein [Pseudoalteromonas rubra]QPB82383.1 hypothetical protein CWC22_005030 [Pseudoalteromonas rubra]